MAQTGEITHILRTSIGYNVSTPYEGRLFFSKAVKLWYATELYSQQKYVFTVVMIT